MFAEGLVVLFAYFICGIALPVLWTIATEAIYGVRESDIFSRTFETHLTTEIARFFVTRNPARNPYVPIQKGVKPTERVRRHRCPNPNPLMSRREGTKIRRLTRLVTEGFALSIPLWTFCCIQTLTCLAFTQVSTTYYSDPESWIHSFGQIMLTLQAG